MTTKKQTIKTLKELSKYSNYSLMDTLKSDPQAKKDGEDYISREVFSGHYVPVKPTPLENPHYIAHSKTLFKELGLDDTLATMDDFIAMFSGDLSTVPKPMKNVGWACGYALSIFGTEYYHQCPFGTGNGYGDGRAISVFETVLDNKRWEMQLKGGGQTPYCRGADGRAVLRSSVREFLAQEHMFALDIPTSRSLTLYTSKTQKVSRPWFRENSYSVDPEVMISEDIAISTRVAPSFLRVGQLELFARRARKNEHANALKELEEMVLHIIHREYKQEINEDLSLDKKVLLLAKEFRNRLASLIANWIRVGYCQGNFNSDNCAVGGFTLDYGPFGFCDLYDPKYQPWTSGGDHFSFLHQQVAAQRNFHMFYTSLLALIQNNQETQNELKEIRDGFSTTMQDKIEKMWASKLGLKKFNQELFDELHILMIKTSLDYTIFFRELSSIPKDINTLKKSFYKDYTNNEQILSQWSLWLEKWKLLIDISSKESQENLSKKMKTINPKYTLREWLLVPAYKQASLGDYTLVKELQEVMINPYDEQSIEVQNKYYALKPTQYFEIAGISHVSCSS
jgi:uncharacterized protein YdiU (UPF0061 family)